MSGKVVSFKLVSTPGKPRPMSVEEYFSRLKSFTFQLIASHSLSRALNFLCHAKGDSELVQDMKALVIRRLSCEALSVSNTRIHQACDQLLVGFPEVPMMKEHMVPGFRELGEARDVIETCRPKPGDPPLVLRAKREALLFNITLLIADSFDEHQGIQTPRFKKAEFIELFSWIWQRLPGFQPTMDSKLSRLVDIHVLAPELPFNIFLPS